jgi:NhaP-type Na+/H+ or K+/H+ antiporter
MPRSRNWFPAGPAKNYALVALLLLAGWLLSKFTGGLIHTFDESAATLVVFFEVVVILVFGFLAYECAKPTVIPSFVLAIFIGMLQRESLAPLVNDGPMLGVLTTTGAAFILFGGGLDTPFGRFRQTVGPILSIAFLGTLVTALMLSYSFQYVAAWQGYTVSIGAIVLLGAALASTDPAAIIPSLKSLVFPKPRVKDIAIGESAINDVVGAVLTLTFLAVLGAASAPASIAEVYGHLLTAHIGLDVARQIAVGCLVGVVGFAILHFWSAWKASADEGGEADAALFMAVPLVTYLVATLLLGNGFLAVFVAGLLFQCEEHFAHVERYFANTIEGLMKPLIFMLLGATVDVHQLLGVAPLGIAMGAIFMFVVRPLAVFLTLVPFMGGKHKIALNELLFLSFVRETGVIPAVLLMGLSASGIEGTDTVVLVGLWIILLTLIVQPPLTPFVAKRLGVATDASAFPKRHAKGPIAVLCSRGKTFDRRMPAVIEWADQHGVHNVTLLHCPEEKYSPEFIEEIDAKAAALFGSSNAARVAQGKKQLHFELLDRPGPLQDNIQALVEQDEVAIIFVGDKMLDYRLDDVKKLRVPFVFVP